MFLLLSTFACGLLMVSAHKEGAPLEACSDFKTKHHPDNNEDLPAYGHQPNTSPYKITPNPASASPGEEVRIIIEGLNGEKLRGFMIQGNDKRGKIVGTFLGTVGLSQTLSCPGGGEDNTATHIDNSDKGPVVLKWIAPTDFTGQVTFRATLVKEHSTFWYNVKSSPLTVG